MAGKDPKGMMAKWQQQREHPEVEEEEEQFEGYRPFVAARVRQLAAMLELRWLNGNSVALHYAWLTKAVYNPSEGITLFFAGHEVRIQGRNLQPLYASLVVHAVRWILEVDRMVEKTLGEQETVVNVIILTETND